MEFRTLTETDIPSLIDLYKQLDPVNESMELEESKQIWEKICEDKNIKYFVAVDGDKVVATCWSCLMPNMTHHGRPICFIENVVTHKDYRKQGLGKKVIQMATEDAKENNCYMVCLLSNSKRTEAHKFYEKIGFNGECKKGFVMRFE